MSLMKILYFMIGIPGSGKTEFAKHLNGTRVSFDDIREDLYGDANEKGVGEEIQREFRKRIYRLIREGKNVIIDYQGLNPKSRKSFIKTYSPNFDKTVAVHINTPLEMCLERNRSRRRFVPEEVILRSHGQLVPPKFEEGFDEILTIDPDDFQIISEKKNAE